MAHCATEPTLDRDRAGIDLDVDGAVDVLGPLCRSGEMIGSAYTLDHVIGIGGMGVIYGALQHSLGRKVAIKVPRPELATDNDACDRLRAEAYAGSRINHRNVVRMIDFGEQAGVPFLVMEHIVGPRLSTLCRAGQLAPAVAANLVLQILAGLEATHDAGVIHGDVKADNVLVTTLADRTFQLHLIDFGLARTLGSGIESSDRVITTQISGTPEYLAPELVCGEPSSVASDLYAVGILFYELVAGVTPFVAETNSQILSRQVAADPIPMACHCGERVIPVAYEKLVRRALAKEPGQRFENAGAFRIALEQVLAGPVVRPRPKTVTGPEAFSSDDVTPVLDPADSKRRVAAARLELQRHAVAAAIANGEPDRIVIAYLDLARTHVDQHEIGGAITELEAGIELLTRRRGAPCRSLWRLQLTLAALYDGSGDRAMAHRVNYEARLQAARVGSSLGTERVNELGQRLAGKARKIVVR